MPDDYPYCELEVFVAGYERGRRYAASRRSLRPTEQVLAVEQVLAEELATRRLTLYDLTREGLLMLGLRATFIPREIFDAGVRRGLSEASGST